MKRTLLRLAVVAALCMPASEQLAQDPEIPLASDSGPGIQERLTDSTIRLRLLEAELGTQHPSVRKLNREIELLQSYVVIAPDADHPVVASKEQSEYQRALQAANPSDAVVAKEFTALVQALRSASGDEKKEPRERLAAIIGFQLGRDFNAREKQLAAAEEKLAGLRKQLEERKRNQGKLADVLMMLVENPEFGPSLPPNWLRTIIPVRRTSTNPLVATADPFSSSNASANDMLAATPGGPRDFTFGRPADSDDPFGAGSGDDPFSDDSGDDPFGGDSGDDPFGAGSGDDPFGGDSGDDPFGGESSDNPFGEANRKRKAAPDQFVESIQRQPEAAYEVSINGRDVAVYEQYDKGIPVRTRETMEISLGEGVSLPASNLGSLWMNAKGAVSINPDPENEGRVVVVGEKKGRVQIALHPFQPNEGIKRINIDVVEGADPADNKPTLPKR